MSISGFAKFVKVDRPARMGRNPQTQEPVRIKASKKARITPLKAFKEAVVKTSLAPKLAKGVWPPAPPGARKAAARKTAAGKAAGGKTAAPRKTAAKRTTGERTTAARRPANTSARTTTARKTTARKTAKR